MTSQPLMPPEALIKRYEVQGPRYTSYPTVPVWTDAFTADDYARHLSAAARAGTAEPMSLYVHIPFCQRLCTYCGCNVVIARDGRRADRYLDVLEHELDLVCERLADRRRVAQIHWGGGTPTFLSAEQLRRLWRALSTRFLIDEDAEVSIEVNPVTTSVDQLGVLRELGFNRLSMGVQDFDPTVQRTINRYQTVEQTGELLVAARSLGFRGVNFDLVYGLPHQTPESWERTLQTVLEMRPDRFAIYAFAFLPETLVHQRKLPVAAMPRGQAKLALLLRAYEAMVERGYRPIGMDHFALPDDELSIAQERRELGRNFQGYTVRAASDVIAVGVSAISDVAGAYAQNAKDLERYEAAIRAGRFATERGLELSDDDRRRRKVISELMCNFHVDLGVEGPSTFSHELEALDPLQADGLVEVHGQEVEVTPLGRYFVRNVAMAFDAYLRRPIKAAFSRTV